MSKNTKKKNAGINSRAAAEPQLQSSQRYFWHYVIFTFTFLLYFNAVFNDYGMDDELVTRNHRLTSKGISAIPEIFSSPYYQDASGYSFEYRPVVLASFAIEHSFFNDNPHVSHFWNVLLYAFTCVLLFQVLKTLFKEYSVYLAVATTLLFAAHTAHTEVVCNIKCRDEIFALFFSLLTIYYALKGVLGNWKYLPLLPLTFSFALMSKLSVLPVVILIPFLLILFTSIHFKQVLLVTALLCLPAFFLMINVGEMTMRISIITATFGVNALLYILLKFERIKPFFQQQFVSAFQSNTQLTEEIGSLNIRTFLKESLPEKSFFTIAAILPAIALLALFFIGVLVYAKIFMLLAIIMIIAGCFFAKERYVFCFLIAALLIFDYTSLFISFNNTIMPAMLLSVAFFLLCRIKTHRLIYMLQYLVLWYSLSVIKGAEWILIGVVFIPFVLLLQSRLRLYTIIVIGVIIMADVLSAFADNIFHSESIGILLVFLIIYFRKKKMLHSALLLTILGTLAYTILQSNDLHIAQKIHTQVNQTHIDVVPNLTNRPLDFVEQCVNDNDTWQIKLGTSSTVLWHYLNKVIIPYPLAYYYGYRFIKPTNIAEPLPILGLIVYVCLALSALAMSKKYKLYAAGVFIYLITISIFSNYVAPIPGMVGDRFLLLPSLGWILVLLFAISKLFTINLSDIKLTFTQISKSAKIVFSLIFLGYSALTFSRNFWWHDTYTLYSHDISYVNNSAQAHNLLAITCLTKARTLTSNADRTKLEEEGIYHLKKAVEIYPAFFNPTYDLGRAYLNMNKQDSALRYFEKTVALNDHFIDASVFAGDLLRKQGKLDEAKFYFEKAIFYYPKEYVYYDRLSYLYFLQQRYTETISINQKAISILPEDPRPYYVIAKTYSVEGRRDSTIYYLNKVFARDANNQLGLQLKQELGLP